MFKSKRKNAGVAALVILQAGLSPLCAHAQLTESNPMNPLSQLNPIRLNTNQQKPISLEKAQTLEVILKPQELQTTPLQPISLAGVKIPGANPATVNMLAMNHFVVINNSNFETMGELYRDNRLKGKPNFVTLDSIVHPYFATTNGLISAVIEDHAMPDLKQVLNAMLTAAVIDYRYSEDPEVKDDIQRNLAFIIVALRLLDPAMTLPDMGGASDLADKEMINIESGFKTRSEIFDRDENFEALAPMGWFARSEKLKCFYRCAQWISRMDFPLTDVTVDTETGSGNLFRRSILMYRALDRAVISGKPAAATWQKLVSAWELFATSSLRNRQKTLLYSEYKSVVPPENQDLKQTLTNLASPFFRTKLLLSVRKQKPVGLGATSIFDLADPSGADGEKTTFRLMPLIEDPELPWLRARAGNYADDEKNTVWCPLSLLVLHARGAQAATNILYNGQTTLQPDMNRLIPELERLVAKPKPGQTHEAVWERSWAILSGYFKQFPPEAQGPLKTDLWMSRHLESAFGGWVDAHLAMAEIKPTKNGEGAGSGESGGLGAPAAAAPATASTAPTASAAGTNPAGAAPTPAPGATSLPASAPLVKPASFHYLEPVPAVFHAIENDAKTLQDKLNSIGYFPARYQQRLNDFMRLAQRLAQIAEKEIAGQATTPVDFKLLAGIDFILEQVSSPLAGALSIISPTPKPLPTITMPSHSLGMTPGASLSSGSSILDSGKTALSKTAIGILTASTMSNKKAEAAKANDAKAGDTKTGDAKPGDAKTASAAPVKPAAKPADSIYKRPLKTANLVLGKPGLVLMVCQTSHGPMLVRGGVYTLYEVGGGPMRGEHLKRKLDFGLLRPPIWAQTFDVVQEEPPKEKFFQKVQ